MKKIILLLLTALAVNVSAQYVPLLENGRQWNVLTKGVFGDIYITHFLDGDTLVNGKNYSKLYSLDHQSKTITFSAMLHEDVSTKQVEVLTTNQGLYGPVIFDFSLNKNDTLLATCMGESWPMIVNTVYQQSILPGINRRALKFEVYDSMGVNYSANGGISTLVEGIGPLSGPLVPYPVFCVTDVPMSILVCVSDSTGALIYKNPDFASCSTIGLNEFSLVTEIDIYPNPVSEVLKVRNLPADSPYKVYDATGKLLKEGRFAEEGIEIKNLKSGIYTLSLLTYGNFVFVKE